MNHQDDHDFLRYLNSLPKLGQNELYQAKRGNKIEAIKMYRARTGRGLKESKDAIDHPEITATGSGLDVLFDTMASVKVKKIVIIPGLHGKDDMVYLHLDKKDPFGAENLVVLFKAPFDSGPGYVYRTFPGVEVEVASG